VLALVKQGVALVNGDCQNGYLLPSGEKKTCGMPFGAHPSEVAGK
jgi:hypothetical protein